MVANCHMDIKVSTPAQGISLIKMEATKEVAAVAEPEVMTEG